GVEQDGGVLAQPGRQVGSLRRQFREEALQRAPDGQQRQRGVRAVDGVLPKILPVVEGSLRPLDGQGSRVGGWRFHVVLPLSVSCRGPRPVSNSCHRPMRGGRVTKTPLPAWEIFPLQYASS